MEETLQQEREESEYTNANEEQGGIRRRLRDRDLLRKRKAEAEEKETNQVESQRKRARAGDRSGAKRRGRPRKSEATAEVSVIQGEAAAPQEAPAVVVVPEPAQVIPDLTSGSVAPLAAVESQPAPVLDVPAAPAAPAASVAPAAMPVFGSLQSPLFIRPVFPPASVNPTPSFYSSSVTASESTKDVGAALGPVQDVAPAPDVIPVSTVPSPPLAAAPQVETLNIESESKEVLDQVLIEDLGPDEEEDIPASQDQQADEDLSGTPSINAPEQNKMFSVLTFSSPPQPPPQEYFPGNSF